MFTERLHLHQLEYPLDEQPKWLNDPLNTQFSEQRHKKHTKESCADYILSTSLFYGLQEVDSGDWVGTLSVFVDTFNRIADMGILIHHEFWGKGYATEAWDKVGKLLLHSCRKLEAGMMANNKAMRRLCERTKWGYEGERQNHFLFNDNPIGLVYYAKWP